eukprot:COSAG05_NODE_2094_length_3573_cov_5.050662_5_plen_276_part_00
MIMVLRSPRGPYHRSSSGRADGPSYMLGRGCGRRAASAAGSQAQAAWPALLCCPAVHYEDGPCSLLMPCRGSAAMPAVRGRRHYDMERKLREFNEQGYVVFEQLFEHEVLDSILPEYMRLYAKVQERENAAKGAYVIQAGDKAGDKVAVKTPLGRKIWIMIPEGCKPGDSLDVIDETSHKSDSPDSMRAPTDEDLFVTGHGRCLPSNRYNLTLPFAQPFADPHIFENPTILEFLERYWGTDEFSLTSLYVNSPGPGSTFQQWHRDGGEYAQVSLQ